MATEAALSPDSTEELRSLTLDMTRKRKTKPRVTLRMRIRKTPTQQTYAKAAFAANGHIKPLYAIIGGRESVTPRASTTCAITSAASGLMRRLARTPS